MPKYNYYCYPRIIIKYYFLIKMARFISYPQRSDLKIKECEFAYINKIFAIELYKIYTWFLVF